jgi:glycine/D-amino acid oxidase-like deaminating enzyme
MDSDLTASPATRVVLVAGSGAAGLTAALKAAADGARVLLVERSAQLGGTTALSFGRVWLPASHHAPADSAQAARTYLSGLYDQMTEAFIAAAPRLARFVERHSPVRFIPCVSGPFARFLDRQAALADRNQLPWAEVKGRDVTSLPA